MLDALTLFKRNVSLHFAGVVDCAICYSFVLPLPCPSAILADYVICSARQQHHQRQRPLAAQPVVQDVLEQVPRLVPLQVHPLAHSCVCDFITDMTCFSSRWFATSNSSSCPLCRSLF